MSLKIPSLPCVILASVFAIYAATPSSANSIFDVSFHVPGGSGITGTIVTDGNIALTMADIITWDLVLNDGVMSLEMTPSNTSLTVLGDGLNDGISFNFGRPDSLFAIEGTAGGICFHGTSGPSCLGAPDSGVGLVVFPDAAIVSGEPSVNINFGTPQGFEVATTPLPATLPLLATGLGALGLLGWRRRRKAPSSKFYEH